MKKILFLASSEDSKNLFPASNDNLLSKLQLLSPDVSEETFQKDLQENTVFVAIESDEIRQKADSLAQLAKSKNVVSFLVKSEKGAKNTSFDITLPLEKCSDKSIEEFLNFLVCSFPEEGENDYVALEYEELQSISKDMGFAYFKKVCLEGDVEAEKVLTELWKDGFGEKAQNCKKALVFLEGGYINLIFSQEISSGIQEKCSAEDVLFALNSDEKLNYTSIALLLIGTEK